MPNYDLPGLPNKSLDAMYDYIIRMERTLRYLFNGVLESSNIFEVGGWRVNNDDIQSKDGDVGMSTADTGGDDVRLWAGGADKDAAPWRVTKAGKMHATGATIESDSGYPKVVLDPAGDLIGAYTSATESIVINAFDGGTNKPFMEFTDGSDSTTLDQAAGEFTIQSGNDITIQATGAGNNISLLPDGVVYINDLSKIYIQSEGTTLDNIFARLGSATGTSGGHDHGIADGTQLLDADGVTIHTFSAATDHTHTKT